MKLFIPAPDSKLRPAVFGGDLLSHGTIAVKAPESFRRDTRFVQSTEAVEVPESEGPARLLDAQELGKIQARLAVHPGP